MPSVVPRVKTISSALRALMNFAGARPGGFVAGRGAIAQFVDAAVDVGVVVFVIMHQRVNHRARFLRRRGVVEINQRLAVDLLVEDGEILSQRGPVNSCFIAHKII